MGHVLTLANLLSLVRLPLAALIWLAPAWPAFALSVIGAAALSDVLDGWFARRMRWRAFERHRDTRPMAAGRGAVGAWLDPLCDKIFVLSALVALTVAYAPPVHLVLLVVARELLLFPAWLVHRLAPDRSSALDYTAEWPGKAATAVQVAAIVLLALDHSWFPPAAWLAGGAGALAAAFYVGRALGLGGAAAAHDGEGRR